VEGSLHIGDIRGESIVSPISGDALHIAASLMPPVKNASHTNGGNTPVANLTQQLLIKNKVIVLKGRIYHGNCCPGAPGIPTIEIWKPRSSVRRVARKGHFRVRGIHSKSGPPILALLCLDGVDELGRSYQTQRQRLGLRSQEQLGYRRG
jgi:hypothetical protein